MSALFSPTALVVPFENLRMTDVEVVGGKNASLGEMISQLAQSGVRVPGGFATRTLQYDAAFIRWLQTAADCPLKASVCSGALLLGAAGFLTDCAATTHPSAYEQLRPYCREVRTDRIVDEGSVITARGVSSSLDLGLHLVKRLAGAEAQAAIRRQMDYPY